MDTIKLKRATKSVANASTKVLEKDEVLVITPDSGSGKGKCQLKFGDGVTATKSLPIAIDGENADEMKVSTIPTISDENPVLSAGETVKVFFGKIKKKFTYLENLLGNVKTVTNLFGSNDAKTVAQGLQNLVNTKFNKSDLYDGTDSTSKSLGATANAVRKVNEKTDNNTSSISQLNSNLVSKLGTGSFTFTRCQKMIIFVNENLQGITLEFIFNEEWSRLLTFSNDGITYASRDRKTGTDSVIWTK